DAAEFLRVLVEKMVIDYKQRHDLSALPIFYDAVGLDLCDEIQCSHKINSQKCFSSYSSEPIKEIILPFNNKRQKLTFPITFAETLNLNPFFNNNNHSSSRLPLRYFSLYAVIIHIGSGIDNGHYIIYVKSHQQVWMKINDCHITSVTLQQVLNKEQDAYLLAYAQATNNESDKENHQIMRHQQLKSIAIDKMQQKHLLSRNIKQLEFDLQEQQQQQSSSEHYQCHSRIILGNTTNQELVLSTASPEAQLSDLNDDEGYQNILHDMIQKNSVSILTYEENTFTFL
ncbi:unnamed protein product, partial [Didymodactylos carnosus]